MWRNICLYATLSYCSLALCITHFLNKDINLPPALWSKYKSYAYENEVWDMYETGIIISNLNLMQNVVVYGLICHFIPDIFVPMSFDDLNVLSVLYLLFQIMTYELVAELYFYSIHRLLHITCNQIHMQHHRSHLIVAASVYDSHIVEHLILNVGALFVPLLLLYSLDIRMPMAAFYIITMITTFNGCQSHSGYTQDGRLHYLHHKYMKKNYGFGFFLPDRIAKSFVY